MEKTDHHQKIGTLLQAFRQAHPKRATAGIYSLSGYMIQMVEYLYQFFEQLDDQEPPQVDTEKLSDILVPKNGSVILIQVKRTLDASTLKSAVKEAYLIMEICLMQTPDLADQLRFRICCRINKTPSLPKSLKMEDVIENGSEDVWNKTIIAFGQDPVEMIPEPLDRLCHLLWRKGIKDPMSFAEECLGIISKNFCEANINNIGWELIQTWQSRQPTPLSTDITRLNLTDFEPDETTTSEFLLGCQPGLGHLRRGFFMERTTLLDDIWEEFQHWNAAQVREGEVPVFWLDGRSGSGKSVLLLQLTQQILKAYPNVFVYRLTTADALLEFFNHLVQARDELDGEVFVLADPLMDFMSREDVRDKFKRCTSSLTGLKPRIITSGYSEQIHALRSFPAFSGSLQVEGFSIPHSPSEKEKNLMIKWHQNRTGIQCSVDFSDNVLILQMAFELGRGGEFNGFASRFKQRLQENNIYAPALKMVVLSALKVTPPRQLFDNADRSFENLAQRGDLHFELVRNKDVRLGYEGVRFAHSTIAWTMFCCWETVPQRPRILAESLHSAMRLLEDRVVHWPDLMDTAFASEYLLDETHITLQADQVSKNQVILDTFRLQKGEDQVPLQSRPKWLKHLKTLPEQEQPEPLKTMLQEAIKSGKEKPVAWRSFDIMEQVWESCKQDDTLRDDIQTLICDGKIVDAGVWFMRVFLDRQLRRGEWDFDEPGEPEASQDWNEWLYDTAMFVSEQTENGLEEQFLLKSFLKLYPHSEELLQRVLNPRFEDSRGVLLARLLETSQSIEEDWFTTACILLHEKLDDKTKGTLFAAIEKVRPELITQSLSLPFKEWFMDQDSDLYEKYSTYERLNPTSRALIADKVIDLLNDSKAFIIQPEQLGDFMNYLPFVGFLQLLIPTHPNAYPLAIEAVGVDRNFWFKPKFILDILMLTEHLRRAGREVLEKWAPAYARGVKDKREQNYEEMRDFAKVLFKLLSFEDHSTAFRFFSFEWAKSHVLEWAKSHGPAEYALYVLGRLLRINPIHPEVRDTFSDGFGILLNMGYSLYCEDELRFILKNNPIPTEIQMIGRWLEAENVANGNRDVLGCIPRLFQQKVLDKL